MARILAGMLDRVGLLSPGLNELVPCAWEIYKTWEIAGQPKEGSKHTNLTCSFKATFSVPSVCVYFMGLWDSINSSGIILDRLFPYASSTAIVHHIRHAVGVDERRAKFKQNLFVPHCYNISLFGASGVFADRYSPVASPMASRLPSTRASPTDSTMTTPMGSSGEIFRGLKQQRGPGGRSTVYAISSSSGVYASGSSSRTTASVSRFQCGGPHAELSHILGRPSRHRREHSEDLVELWFPGDHGDVGGGWEPRNGPHLLSDIPLAWILAESVKFDVIFKEGNIEEFRASHDPEECLVSPMHDSLNIFRRQDEGSRAEDPWWRPIFWWFLEMLPIAYRVENEDERWTRVAVPNFGRARTLPPGAKLHWSVSWRMRLVDSYRPFEDQGDGSGSGDEWGYDSEEEIPDDFHE